MERYCKEKNTETRYTIRIIENAPLQNNNVDFGVFLCLNAEKIARHVSLKVEKIRDARNKMIVEIMSNKLLRNYKPSQNYFPECINQKREHETSPKNITNVNKQDVRDNRNNKDEMKSNILAKTQSKTKVVNSEF